MTPDGPAPENRPLPATGRSAQRARLLARLERLEQQLQSFKALHARELSDLAEKLDALTRLHADELQLMLDELHDVADELSQLAPEEHAGPPSSPASAVPEAATLEDPAARSPKRARWLAERQAQTRQPVSRRELLLGRADRRDPPGSAG